jgi:NADPH:quinone reductase
MKAILVHQFGGPEVLQIADVPTPKPDRGQVLVRVKAAGVNPYDTYMRAGSYAIKPALPYTPGSDSAGIVETVGEGVNAVKPGDRVYLTGTVGGAYAEFALAPEREVHRLPGSVTFVQGAGVWVPYGTAYHAIVNEARAHAGETVLIHGASGGVGVAAIQVARSLGLRVFGTAGSPRGLELVKAEGAHLAFDHGKAGYRDEILKATDGRGVGVVLEMLANVNLGYDLTLLAPGGRVIVIGSRGEVTINPRDLMVRRASVHAFTLWGLTDAERSEVGAALAAGLENGTLRPVVGKELPLAEAARAHVEVMSAGAYGKIVLLP